MVEVEGVSRRSVLDEKVLDSGVGLLGDDDKGRAMVEPTFGDVGPTIGCEPSTGWPGSPGAVLLKMFIKEYLVPSLLLPGGRPKAA